MRVTNWEAHFPRLSDLYRNSDMNNPSNYFLRENVVSALSKSSQAAIKLEKEFQRLSAVAWTEFKPKALKYVCVTHPRRDYNALFECFNEVKGYIRLSSKYEDIHFIPESSTTAPDLIAFSNTSSALMAFSKTSSALMEVKTINESDKELDYFDIPLEKRDALRVEHAVSESLKAKVSSAISKAEKQLLGYTKHTVTERIIYLVVRLDFQCATSASAQDLDSFLKGQSGKDIMIERLILN